MAWRSGQIKVCREVKNIMSANEILGVVTTVLALVSTYAGANWQKWISKAEGYLSRAEAAESTVSDLTAQVNNVIIAAKDGTVDETAFQKVVDDAKAFVKDL